MALLEARDTDLARQLLYLTMREHSTTRDGSSTSDYIKDHTTYPSLPPFDVSQVAINNIQAALPGATNVDHYFIMEALDQLLKVRCASIVRVPVVFKCAIDA